MAFFSNPSLREAFQTKKRGNLTKGPNSPIRGGGSSERALSLVQFVVVVYWKLASADELTALLLADILYPQTISRYESSFGLAMH